MKRSKLLLVSVSALVSVGLIAGLVKENRTEVKAASFVDSIVTDEFATGIDAEAYDVIDSAGKVGLVEKNGTLKFGGSDYNQGYFRHAEALTRGSDQSVVFQFKKIALQTGQWLCMQFTTGYAWASNMLMMDIEGNQVWLNGASTPHSNATGDWSASQWVAINSATYLRFVWNADGSVIIYGSAWDDTAAFSKLCYFDAGTFSVPTTGYVGMYGNGLTGVEEIDDAKVGLADDGEFTNLSWVIQDDFEVANNGKFIVDTTVVYNSNVIFEQAGGVKAVMLNDAASGEGIVTKQAYQYAEQSSKLFKAELSLDVTALSAKAIGLGFGLANDATATNSAYLVGVRSDGTNGELVLLKNGEVLENVTLSTNTGLYTISAFVMKNAEGKNILHAFAGNGSLSHEVENPEGRLAIGLSGEGSTIAKVIKLVISTYKGAVESGRDLAIDFSKGIDHNWIAEDGLGKIDVNDGVLHLFSGNGDGTRLQTRHKYANFDLQFDARMQQYEEDDDGNVIKPSTWIGINFGRKNLSDMFWADGSEMIYFTGDTINSLVTQDGHTPTGTPTARGWFTTEFLPLAEANNGIMFHYHIRAVDGEVSVGVSREGVDEVTFIIYEGMNVNGYIAFSATSGADYYLDNITVLNLDGNTEANHAPVAQDLNVEATAGVLYEGQVVATDEDEYDAQYLTYELVEDDTGDLASLVFNADGSFSLSSNEDVEGEVSFTYKAFDTEDYSEVKTVTVQINESPVHVARVAANEELQAYYDALLAANQYDEAGQVALLNALNDGFAAINAAESVEAIQAALAAAKAAMDAVEVYVEPGTSESEVPGESEEPGESSEVPGESEQPGESSEEKPAKKGGCGGSILATSAILTILALAGGAIVLSKKKED